MLRKKWKAVLLLAAAIGSFSIGGCQEKVVTVASVLDEAGEVAGYIEMQELELKEAMEDSGREEAQYCAVMIPLGYYESPEIPGMYLHEKAPLDSSNIYYSMSDGSGRGQVSPSLTEKEYRETIEEALKESGQEGTLEIESFEEIDMEGVPAYKIRSSYATKENEIQQLTYLVLADNTYTITYSQSADDELMADFEISDGQIRLVREENVETARSGGQ